MNQSMRTVQKEAKKLSAQYSAGQYKNINEANTTNSLVNPFLKSLGWDISKLDNVSAQFHLGNGGIPDLVLLSDSEIKVIIEVKRVGTDLKQHIEQLEEYFNKSSAHIGVLTDGIQYWFFSWSDGAPRMNKSPFAIIDIRDLKLNNEDSFLLHFRHDKFNARYFKWFSHADYTYAKIYHAMGKGISERGKDKRLAKKVFYSVFSKYPHPENESSEGGKKLDRKRIAALYNFVQYHSRWNYNNGKVRVL